jgi:small GTP-binding protein
MPTNVTPEYRKAEEAYREAKTLDEKVERLEDMIALLPKHKGTDHLYADLKRRLSKLRKELESSGGKRGGGAGLDFTREGAAQVVLVGPPNSGKSSIVRALTHAHTETGDYPFTTMKLIPGMAQYQDIQIQIIDTPPMTAEYMHMHILGIVRSADAVLIVSDLSNDAVLDDVEMILNSFRERHVEFVREREEVDRDRILCRIIAHKSDARGAEVRLALLQEFVGDRLEIIPLSCTSQEQVSQIPEMLFHWLRIVRVYTKMPGEKAEMNRPFTVFSGQNVGDICTLVHRDFAENLRFARLWRKSDMPITVSREELVADGDILELHM